MIETAQLQAARWLTGILACALHRVGCTPVTASILLTVL